MRKEKPFFLLIMLTSIALISLCIDEGHNWGDDFALYISQAISILNNTTNSLYINNKFAMENSTQIIGPYLYPVGFPFLLSGVYCVFGMNFVIMKVFCSLFFIFTLLIIYIYLKSSYRNNVLSLFALSVFAFHPALISFSDNILSDFPFLFFSMLSLYLIGKNKNSGMFQIITGISVGLACITRDIGLFLIISMTVYQVQNMIRDYKERNGKIFSHIINYKLYALSYFMVFIVILIKNIYYPFSGNSNHIKFFIDGINYNTIIHNVRYYSYLFAYRFISPIYYLGNNSVLVLKLIAVFNSIAVFIIMLFGLIKSYRNHLHFTVYLITVMALLLIFPGTQGLRYAFPILPIFVFFFINGFLAMDSINLRKFAISISVFTVLFIFLSGISFTYKLYKLDTNKALNSESIVLYKFISDNIPKNSVIIFNKPRLLALMTGRNSILINNVDQIYSSGADYLLYYSENEEHSADMFKPVKLIPVYSSIKFSLYKIVKGS